MHSGIGCLKVLLFDVVGTQLLLPMGGAEVEPIRTSFISAFAVSRLGTLAWNARQRAELHACMTSQGDKSHVAYLPEHVQVQVECKAMCCDFLPGSDS